MENLFRTRRLDAPDVLAEDQENGAAGDTPVQSSDEGALTAPIFFVGMPRSGTTVFFEAFAKHERLAWLTNYSRQFPSLPALNVLCHALDGGRWGVYGSKRQYGRVALLNAVLPRPDEAYPFWEKYAGMAFAREYLRGVSASPAVAARLRFAIAAVVRWQGGRRFATKITGPARMAFLSSVFPDAYFVHVIRDGRAVVESLLRSRFWIDGGGHEAPWWNGGPGATTQDAPGAPAPSPALLAARQWRDIIEVAREEAERVLPGRYIEARYEDFVDDPHAVVRDLYRRCALPDSARAHQYIERVPLVPELSKKYRETLSQDEIEGLSAAMQPWLETLGYR
jgi:hypothetical protein